MASDDEQSAEQIATLAQTRLLSSEQMIEYAFLTTGMEPHTFKEAMESDNAPGW